MNLRTVLTGLAAASLLAVLLLWRSLPDPPPLPRTPAPGPSADVAQPAPEARAAAARPVPPAWGPSPFGPAPARELPLPGAGIDTPPSRFAVAVAQFEALRSQVLPLPGARPELEQLARSLQAALPQWVRQGDVSGGEALLLSAALLEILEPDTQLRESELARWRRQFMPAGADSAS